MGPLNYLLNWSLDQRVLHKLKGTGFDALRGFNQHLSLNLPLINVLISRYDVDTQSFKLGSAENTFNIAFGLEDVLYLTGLPIDGKPVTGVDPKDIESVCQQYLGKHEGCAYGRGSSYISLNWLKENFMTLNDKNLSEKQLAYHVRAYVMYAIGCTFAPSHNLSVSPVFLPLLENVEDIGSYAWGAALLASFHDSIGNPTKCSIGFYFPLMVFAYIRFPALSSMFKLDRAAINAFPLVVSWSNALGLVMGQHFKNHDEENLETFFDNLKEEGIGEEVKWQPYKELSSNFLPRHLREQVVLSKSRTILICFEKAVYHRPDKCQRQLGLAGHILKDKLIEIQTISRKGKKSQNGTDWSKKGKYSDYISEWDKRFDLLIDRDAIATPDQAKASDYQIDALVQANAAPDQAKASDHLIDVPLEENATPPDQATASYYQMDALVEANSGPDLAKASDHLMDVPLEENATTLDQGKSSDYQIDALVEANAAPDQAKASDHLMDVPLEKNTTPDQAKASDHTNVSLIVAEAGSVNDDVASSEKTVVFLDNQDPENDSRPFEEEAQRAEASLIAELRKENEKLMEEASLIAKLRKENEILKEETRRAEASLIAELWKENEKLKEEIELYRNFPVHLNRKSRVGNVDVDHQNPGDTTSSRVRSFTEIRSCNPQTETINVKRQRVSPSTTTAGGVVDRAKPPPLIIYVDSDSNSDSDSNVSITDSYMDALVGLSKKSVK